MAIVAGIINRSEPARYLKHLGLERECPVRSPLNSRGLQGDLGD